MSWWKETLKHGKEQRGQAYTTKKANLLAETPGLIIESLTKDKRFKQISEGELIYLTAELSLLKNFNKFDSNFNFNSSHGVLFRNNRSGFERLFLPRWLTKRGLTPQQIVDKLMEKQDTQTKPVLIFILFFYFFIFLFLFFFNSINFLFNFYLF